MSFNDSLKTGKIGESKISGWLKSRGFNILPVYEIEKDQYSGPCIYSCEHGNMIAPDILAFNHKKTLWIEAKNKTAFCWYRKKQIWTTGIDLKHYLDYIKVSKLVSWDIWILFLQNNGIAKDTPNGMVSPVGLFGNKLSKLQESEDHRSDKWSNGMVYWSHESLIKLSDSPIT